MGQMQRVRHVHFLPVHEQTTQADPETDWEIQAAKRRRA
jgi:hypothetical protein